MPLRARARVLAIALVGGCAACQRDAPSPAPPPASATSAAVPGSASAALAPAPAAEIDAAAEAALGPAGKVLVFGDSITQADWEGHIAPEEKWVTALGAKSDRMTAVNAGKNGRTTSALAELRVELRRHPEARMVLIALGTNDLKNAKPGTVERATANVGKMIDVARSAIPEVEVVVCSPPNINVGRLTSYWREHVAFGQDTVHYLRALSAAYRTLSERKGARFVDLFGVVSAEHLPDGVHPNGKGQLEIADAVWRGLGGA